MISIRLFGKFSVHDSEGVPIPIAGAKTLGLLAYLALNTEMPPSRDRLMTLFWGDRFTEQARQSLRQAIAKLKRTLSSNGAEVILAEHDRVGLNPDAVSVDVDTFARLAHSTEKDAPKRALELLSGPLLEGFYGQQPEFEDWITSERQRYTTMSLGILERACEQSLREGNASQALEYAENMVSIDPLRDASQHLLIRILAQKGERAAAVQQFNSFEMLLKRELGVGPGPELLKLMTQVRSEGLFPGRETAAAQTSPSTSAQQSGRRTSIAVVPFATLSREAEHEAFTEGLTEDITTNLSRFSWLAVKASTPHSGPRLTSQEMSELGKELNLDYVVHGSLRAMGGKLRLTVQLAEPSTARYVWVMRYDRETGDFFSLQDDLAETVAASIEAELQRYAGRDARNTSVEEMSAWDCYHRGLAAQYEFDADRNLKAQEYFRRAIELDPNFGLAYARLSYTLVISTIYFESENVDELLDEALELARTAARLEPDDAVVRFAMGRVYLARGEYERSKTDLKAAIDLNPGMAQAHCGLGDALAYSGELEGALACFEEAVRISPADPYRWAFLSYGATALLFKGAYEEAASWAAEAEAVPNAHYWPTAIRVSALAHLNRKEEAASALAHLKERRPGITCDFVRSRLFYLKDPEQVETYISGLRDAGLS